VFAEYALIHEPFRAAAKEQYLDMLRRRRYVLETANACVQFGWKEAIPRLDASYRQAHSLGEFEAAFRAKRTLEGRPVPAEIDRAQQQLQHWVYSEEPPTREDLAAAKEMLRRSSDTEAAIVVAIRVSLSGFKASYERISPVQEVGREVLRVLPRQETAGIIQRLAGSLAQDPSNERTVQALRELLTSESRQVGIYPITARPENTPIEETPQVLLDFKIAKVRDDLRPDRETVLLLASALGAESRLARELLQPGQQRDLTLGEILQTYIAPQPLPAPAADALIAVLQSRGFLEVTSQPNVLAADGQPAQVRIIMAERFLPSSEPSGPIERIEYGTAVNTTARVLDAGRVSLEMMAEVSDLVPGRDFNQPTILRTSAETSVTAWNDRYLVWAAVTPTAAPGGQEADGRSVYIMVRPQINLSAPAHANTAGSPESPDKRRRQVLLDVRTVTLDRSDLLNLGVEWGWPRIATGTFPDPAARDVPGPGSAGWPWGVQIGYTADRTFTESLLMTLDLLRENRQAEISSQRILAQDGRPSRLKTITEEWLTVTVPAAEPSALPQTRSQKADSGTILAITPYIGPSGDITVQIALEISERVNTPPATAGHDLPILTRRTARNTLTIKDGGTVAIAGMRENPVGPGDKSGRETAIFVTAHLVSDNAAMHAEASPAATAVRVPPKITATFTETGLHEVLAEIAERGGVKITTDAMAKFTHVTTELVKIPVEAALRQVLKTTPYTFEMTGNDTFLVSRRPLSFDFQGYELGQALQDLSVAAGVPIIPGPDVARTEMVNVRCTEVSLDTALEMVLAGKPFIVKKTPHYYLVGDRSIAAQAVDDVNETHRVRLSQMSAVQAKAHLSPACVPYVHVESAEYLDPNDRGRVLTISAPSPLAERIVASLKQIDVPRRQQVFLDMHLVLMEQDALQNLRVDGEGPTRRTSAFPRSTAESSVRIDCAPDRPATASLLRALNAASAKDRACLPYHSQGVAADGRQIQARLGQREWSNMTEQHARELARRRAMFHETIPQETLSATVLSITPCVDDNNNIAVDIAIEVDAVKGARQRGARVMMRRMPVRTVTLQNGGTLILTNLLESQPQRSNQGGPAPELVIFITADLILDRMFVP